MASFNKKTYVITAKKTWRKKYYKYAIVFASTQLRINRLRRYPIDPKAYLGRCECEGDSWRGSCSAATAPCVQLDD